MTVLYLLNQIVKKNIENNIDLKLDRYKIQFELNINYALNDIQKFSNIVAKNSDLVTAVSKRDTVSLDSILGSKDIFYYKDIFILDSNNNYLFASGLFEILKNYSGLSASIANEYSIISIDSGYVMVYTTNILNPTNKIGTFNKGVLVKDLFMNTNYDEILFLTFIRNNLIFSSFNKQNDSLDIFINTHRPIIDAVLATGISSEIIPSNLGCKKVYLKIFPFGYNIPAYNVIAITDSNEFYYLDLLNTYLIFILCFYGFILIVPIFIMFKKLSTPEMSIQKSEAIHTLKVQSSKDEPPDTTSIKIIKDLKATILCSKISTEEMLNVTDLQKILSSYHKIQTELIEMYEGNVENILNYFLVASVAGNENTLKKVIYCAEDILKIISKESQSTACHVSIAINYGPIYYSGNEQKKLIGRTLEKTQAILKISKPGEILIPQQLLQNNNIPFANTDSKVLRFKDIKEEIRLVNLSIKN
jgi:hypothetical protein